MKIDAKLDLNVDKVCSRFDPKYDLAQKRLDSEVVRCSSPYVPMRSGQLMRSGENGTKLGSGLVVWNTPYARRMYYGLNYHFSTDKHPQACAQWFEKAKAVHKDAWLKTVQETVKG